MARPPGQKRQPILDGALEAFVDSGFHGATIPRIAKCAGVSPATCYLYFDSKEALANALLRQCLARAVHYTRTGIDAQEPSRAAFMDTWRGMLHFGREHPLEYLFLSRALYDDYLDDESKAMLVSVDKREMESLERWRVSGLVGDVSLFEIRALIRGHARVLVELAAAEQVQLNDELIERSGRMTWAGLVATRGGTIDD